MPDSQATFDSYLNVRSAYAPSFDSSGKRVAFLMDVTGVPQVWLVDAKGGWPRQLTFFGERVSLVSWCPSGDSLLFAMDEGGSERHQLYLIDLDAGGEVRALTDSPAVMHIFGGWSPDGASICVRQQRAPPGALRRVRDGGARRDGANGLSERRLELGRGVDAGRVGSRRQPRRHVALQRPDVPRPGDRRSAPTVPRWRPGLLRFPVVGLQGQGPLPDNQQGPRVFGAGVDGRGERRARCAGGAALGRRGGVAVARWQAHRIRCRRGRVQPPLHPRPRIAERDGGGGATHWNATEPARPRGGRMVARRRQPWR